MNIFRVLIAVLILASAGVGGYFFYQTHEEERLRQEFAARIQAQHRAAVLAATVRPLADKSMDKALPKAYPRSVSDWKSTEKKVYQKLLAAEKFDVLVVPFQVQEYALDRATRSLMTAQLALAIAAGQKRTPNPYLVARALGDGDRRLDPKEVYAFADKIGVKKIIWGYVGHDRSHTMAVSIQSQERNANGVFNVQAISAPKNFERIAFTDEKPPIEAYQTVLPDMLTAIGIDGSVLALIKPDSSAASIELPDVPLGMVSDKQAPARDALFFQLLASLTPHAAERVKERFTEKSLLAIYSMSPDAADYRVLKARAYMLLGLRPAALQLLAEPKTPEENELVAALNGNQPDVERFGSQIKPLAKRTMAMLDANYLGQAYARIDKSQSLATAASLKLPGKIWPFFAARAFADSDLWAQFDNVYLKQLLDHEFPIKDYTVEGMIRGVASLGDAEKLQTMTDLSVINHIHKLLETDAAKWCCQSSPARLSAVDYLDLIEAIGNDDLMRRADFLTDIQGAPERTLDFLNRIESVYKGHPEFTLARAQAQIRMANTVEGAEKEGLLKSAYVNLFDVMYWEQGQSYLSAGAFNQIGVTGRQDYGYFDNCYAADYPFRPYYPNWENYGRPEYLISNAEAALRNATSDVTALNYLDWHFKKVAKQPDKRDALFKSIEGRFAGNPAIYQLWAQKSLDNGDAESANKYFRESIKAQPTVWQPYMALGNLLIEQGQLQAANQLFMSYPAFKNGSSENPVGTSNSAYEAGTTFYWLGEFSLATPLYRLASRQETGSSADISSRLRLKLLEGDLRGALSGSLERARRYNNSYAYRDYLGMLHAMGASKDAWAAFNVLASQTDNSSVWESVLVGHRIEGKSETEIAAWAKQMAEQNIGKKSDLAANHLLRAGVMDRIPSKELAASLDAIALPVWKNNTSSNQWTIRPSLEGTEFIVGPRMTATNKNATHFDENIPQKNRVKSDTVYFAEAYRAIRTGEFAAARTSLEEAAILYDLSNQDDLSYLLPYYAFAAAKAGDVSKVEKYMADFSVSEKGFDYLLAHAVIAGIGGKIEESVQLLKSALYKRPFTDKRPLPTEYQYAEVCKWLYEATGNRKYMEITLDWAKKNQKFQPWFAWAYAMEAVLSGNKTDRRRAIAMAVYLDPQSEMLGRISKTEREKAIWEFKKENPFLKEANTAMESQI